MRDFSWMFFNRWLQVRVHDWGIKIHRTLHGEGSYMLLHCAKYFLNAMDLCLVVLIIQDRCINWLGKLELFVSIAQTILFKANLDLGRSFSLRWLALYRWKKLRRNNTSLIKIFPFRWLSYRHFFLQIWMFDLQSTCFGWSVCLLVLLWRYVINTAWFSYTKDVLDNSFFIKFFSFKFLWFCAFLFLRNNYFLFFSSR